MAIIKSKEIREMDDKTITTKLFELRSELVSLNAQVAMGTAPENPGKIGEIKRTIARILTIQKQKEGENKVWLKYAPHVGFQRTFAFAKQ
mgnify:CR=1 FL=1